MTCIKKFFLWLLNVTVWDFCWNFQILYKLVITKRVIIFLLHTYKLTAYQMGWKKNEKIISYNLNNIKYEILFTGIYLF